MLEGMTDLLRGLVTRLVMVTYLALTPINLVLLRRTRDKWIVGEFKDVEGEKKLVVPYVIRQYIS